MRARIDGLEGIIVTRIGAIYLSADNGERKYLGEYISSLNGGTFTAQTNGTTFSESSKDELFRSLILLHKGKEL